MAFRVAVTGAMLVDVPDSDKKAEIRPLRHPARLDQRRTGESTTRGIGPLIVRKGSTIAAHGRVSNGLRITEFTTEAFRGVGERQPT